MTRALLIGCGNIGAQYDLKDPAKVWTHAKAYSLIGELELTVTDINIDKAREIAGIYKTKILEKLTAEDYKNFDLVSITTPTSTHFQYLKEILNSTNAVVICEKPVVNSLREAESLVDIYHRSNSKVLVNYIRRFQPAYKLAKEQWKSNADSFSTRQIIIKYRRGFLNNGSHAVDLLEYLFDRPFDFNSFSIQKVDFDSFDDDPTITGSCTWSDIPVNFIGVSNVNYPVFEIEIFNSDSKIVICHSGNEIRYYSHTNGELKEVQEQREKNILDNYMVHVVDEALDLLNKRKTHDNFISSLKMNERILQIIEPVKNK